MIGSGILDGGNDEMTDDDYDDEIMRLYGFLADFLKISSGCVW